MVATLLPPNGTPMLRAFEQAVTYGPLGFKGAGRRHADREGDDAHGAEAPAVKWITMSRWSPSATLDTVTRKQLFSVSSIMSPGRMA